MRIVHAYDRAIIKRYGAGNWKDISGRKLVLADLQIPHDTLEIAQSKDLLHYDFSPVSDLIIEYSWWADVLRQVRQRFPKLRVHVRTHNAEAIHALHRAELSVRHPKKSFQELWRALGALRADCKTRRLAHTLLGISDWDNEKYWRRLPGRSRIEFLPYFCPWPYLEQECAQPIAWDQRPNTVVCMPGARDRVSLGLIDGFRRFANHLTTSSLSKDWEFALTRGVIRDDVQGDQNDGCISAITTDNPWELLCRVRAVTILTELGFGMKTTIVDGLAAGCHVLVERRLAQRLPEFVREACTVVDLGTMGRADDMMRHLSSQPPVNTVNENFKEMAGQVIKTSLGHLGGPTSATPQNQTRAMRAT